LKHILELILIPSEYILISFWSDGLEGSNLYSMNGSLNCPKYSICYLKFICRKYYMRYIMI